MNSSFAPIPQPVPNCDFSIDGITVKPENNPFVKIQTIVLSSNLKEVLLWERRTL